MVFKLPSNHSGIKNEDAVTVNAKFVLPIKCVLSATVLAGIWWLSFGGNLRCWCCDEL